MNESEIGLNLGRRREYATLIRESGTHLFSVVNGILDMTKIDAADFEIRPEPVRLASVIGGCCDLLALTAREPNLQIVDVAPLPEIVAEKRALKQIVINVVSNATKFSNCGGRITVRAVVEGNRIALTVADNGIGIREGTCRASASRCSRRAARPHDATGLGLSIVKGLVALHDGQIASSSRLGEGMRLTASRSIASRHASPLHHPINAQRPPAQVGPAASNTARMVGKSA